MSSQAVTGMWLLLFAQVALPADSRRSALEAPLYFEENRGQLESGIAFAARIPGQRVLLRDDGSAVHTLSPGGPGPVELALSGGRAHTVGIGEDRLPSVTHYYTGNDRPSWHTDVPHYGRVRFPRVYDGIDLVWNARRQIEYEFHVSAGADAAAIRFRIQGPAHGWLDRSGNLTLETGAGRVCYGRPHAYQVLEGRRQPVGVRFRLAGGLLSFQLGPHNPRLPLVIDPVLRVSTYLGGSASDAGYSVAVDSAGNIYVTGETASPDFPAGAATSPRNLNRDVFVTKLSADGSTVLYTTILASSADDSGRAIAVTASGEAWVAGYTNDRDFPITPGALQPAFRGPQSAFVAKLDASGHLAYSTYLGGERTGANGIALDSVGNVYVTGYTASVQFPTTAGAPQTTFQGGLSDAFLSKLDASGRGLLYSTYLGGVGNDLARAVAVDSGNNACVVGFTDSINLPVVNPLQPNLKGSGDALLACLNTAGTRWNYVTYWGGSGADDAYGVAIDSSGIYMTGATSSDDFPTTPGAYQTAKGTDYDAFVTKLNPSGTAVIYATLVGGNGSDAATGIALDAAGQAWIAGHTTSTDFPSRNFPGTGYRGSFDTFLFQLNTVGTALVGSACFGGTGDDRAFAVAGDHVGGVVVTGYTSSVNFPTAAGGFRTANAGSYDAFVTSLAMDHTITGRVAMADGSALAGITVTLTGAATVAGVTDSAGSFIFTSLPNGTVTVTPSGAGYTFTPASQSVTTATGAVVNFTAAKVVIVPPPAPTNLALGKAATQSSTLSGYSTTAAGSAVDGNTNGSFFNGSTTHTNLDANAWWQVDLGTSASITSITIWNRTDCCSTRLNDYWVFVSDTPFGGADTPASLQGRAGTWSHHETTYPNPSITIAAGAQGRYVRVQLTGANFLSLAEVQVLGAAGTRRNVALGKAATQSSTLAGYSSAAAGAAVDGNTDGGFFNGSTTHTNPETNAWWQVDLGTSAAISSITVWNRTDCCGSRLNDYWVFVSDTPFGPSDTPASLQGRAGAWSHRETIYPNPSTSIAVGAQGRYVRVQLTGANPLSLAEVQVFTDAAALPNLAIGKAATQSSTLPGYSNAAAASAVDGNTDGSFYHNSTTHTNADANAWWQVDLGASSAITSITVWNRTDCCGSRLNDYWVFVSDTLFGPSDTPASLQARPGTWSHRETTYPNPSSTIAVGAQGRYVRVQLTGTNPLSLAEVQVF